MSGGQLVVLDRLGRDVKRFPLAQGLVTLGSDHSCDIRFMLDSVNPHHATIAVHANQTVVRNVCEGETLVNERAVSVAALRHGDVISIGGRQLRWDYADPTVRRPQAPQPALYVGRRKPRAARRGSGAAPVRRDPALQLALEMSHRASMPASAGGKQVAIVQPQRRDTNDHNEKTPPRTPSQASKRSRSSKNELDVSVNDTEAEKAKRKSNARASLKSTESNLQNTTKATLWIESRKTSPRKSAKLQSPQHAAGPRRSAASAKKSTPLRLAVLRRAQSAHKINVMKIQAPAEIDHTKQAAILLMTGHTPKSKLLSQKSPSPKSTSPKSVTPSLSSKSATPGSSPRLAPPRSSSGARRASPRSASFVLKRRTPVRRSSPRDRTVTILEITDSDGRNSSLRSSSRRSGRTGLEKSPLLPSPKKSALKNPLSKTGTRKSESIKFDLSNLENHSQESEAPTDTSRRSAADGSTEDDVTLHYSDTSASMLAPSPRRAIHSRSSRILQRSLGASPGPAPAPDPACALRSPESPRARSSPRGRVLVQKALEENARPSPGGRRSAGSLSAASRSSVATAFRTRTLSPRSPQANLESYSIVDLVSIDSNESGRSASVYDSAGSTSGASFNTPQDGSGRRTRSTMNPTLLGSSTPYVKAATSSTPRSRSSPDVSSKTSNDSERLSGGSSVISRKTKSISTPENSTKRVSMNSTRISRVSRSRSRINDSDLMLVEADDADESPRTSRKVSTTSKRSSSAPQRSSNSKNTTPIGSPGENEGTSTPENKHSPEEASTPVLSIQTLLDSSQSSIPSRSSKRKGRASRKRKTIGILTRPKTRVSTKSKSMSFSARKTRLRLSSDSYDNMNVSTQQDSEIVTPKSAVKLVQEAVKNKHSTAKKPQSKRSIIDDLNESDIVKQLFNSPVKRKLSQSMTEFSRKQLLEDEDAVQGRRATRNTVPATGDSLLDHSESFTPERFVSPISTPSHSPDLTGLRLMFGRTEPENDLRNVRGVKALLRTPRARKSIKDDLTDVAGVKVVFAKSPRNRLSDVRVKEVFASSPKNDLTRVSGVKALFHSHQERKSPRNSLGDVRGVKKLFSRRSPDNDLRNVSGVKRTLRKNSPTNDLSDVRGVKRMFRREKRDELNDVSGVEELFNVSSHSHRDTDSLFDQLIGKPPIKAVYSKTFSSRSAQKKKPGKRKSLHVPLDVITNNVEEWLQQELQKRLHKEKAKSNVTRELQKLATDTVEGATPIRTSRVRNSSIVRASVADEPKPHKSASELYSPHTLPIKKRSLVDASSEGATSTSKPIKLPIKKRAVVHSTPVKGRHSNLTMNASELGRVSPIVPDTAHHVEHEVPRADIPKETIEARPKSRRGTKASPESPLFMKPSPKKTRGKSKLPTPTKAKPTTPAKEKSPAKTKTPSPAKKLVSPVKKPATPVKKPASPVKKPASPVRKPASPVRKPASPVRKPPSPARKPASPVKKPASPVKKPARPVKSPVVTKPTSPKTTRSRRAVVSSPPAETSTKKRGATLVVAKKSPVMSPQPKASRKRKEPETLPTPTASPKRTRATRNKSEIVEKPKTPKNTRAKVQKATVVVSKPSPQLKPRATRRKTEQAATETSKTARQAAGKNKVNSKKVESPEKSPTPKKSAKNVSVEHVPKTRGRKTAAIIDESKNIVVDSKAKQPKSKRGLTTNADELTVTRKTRKTVKQEPAAEEPKTKSKKVEKRGQPVEETEKKITRGKKIETQVSVQSEPTTRSRRGAKPDSTVIPEVNPRKRKSTASNERPIKVRKNEQIIQEKEQVLQTRRRNKKVESPKSKTPNLSKKSGAKESKEKKQASLDVPKKSTRSKQAEVAVEAPKEPEKRPVRGKKAAVVEPAPEVGKRKRKTAVEAPVVVEGASKKSRGASRAAASPRATRGATLGPANKAGRSRRR